MTRRPSAPASLPRPCARPERQAGGTGPLRRLGAAARRLEPELASGAAVRRVERLLARLPQDLSDNLIYECRLGSDAGRLDVSFRFERAGAGTARLAGGTAPGEGPPPWPAVRRLAARWCAADSALAPMDALWVEVDLPPNRPVPKRPGVFFGLTAPAAGKVESAAALAPRLAATAALLRPGLDAGRLHRRLAEVLGALPALPGGARLFQTGLMLGRDDPRIRLCFEGLGPHGVHALLVALGADAADRPEMGEALALAAGADDLALAIDVGEDVGPRVGLELYTLTGSDDRLDRLLGRLEGAGLCSADQRRRLLAYRGKDLEEEGREPSDPVLVARALSHLKLVTAPGAPLRAKAYLAVKRHRPDPRLLAPPGVALQDLVS